MGIGLKVGGISLIELGQIKEELIYLLDRNGIAYKIMFDKVRTNTNIRETIISIPDMEVEVSLENDFVHYIKSKPTCFSELITTDNSLSGIEKVNSIIESLKTYFEISEVDIHDINIDSLDLRVITRDTQYKYRIHIMTTQKDESFIYTMKII